MGGVQRKFELTAPQIGGGALAAATAAVTASYLGVAGTVLGAAVVSVGTTVGTAVYAHYLKRTGEKVKQHTANARRGHASEGAGIGGSSTLPAAGEEPRRRLRWTRVAAAAGLVFAISMGSILTYQTVADRTVAEQLTGKPARKQLRAKPATGRDKHAAPGATARPTRTTASPSASPSPSPSATAPVTPALTPTLSATPAPSASTPPAASTPTPAPTGMVSATGSPQADVSPPVRSPSPVGTVPEPQHSAPVDRPPAPECRPADGHAPAC
ncbi:hypothetical protein ACWDA3_58285 [Nonomuraea rubra]